MERSVGYPRSGRRFEPDIIPKWNNKTQEERYKKVSFSFWRHTLSVAVRPISLSLLCCTPLQCVRNNVLRIIESCFFRFILTSFVNGPSQNHLFAYCFARLPECNISQSCILVFNKSVSPVKLVAMFIYIVSYNNDHSIDFPQIIQEFINYGIIHCRKRFVQ